MLLENRSKTEIILGLIIALLIVAIMLMTIKISEDERKTQIEKTNYMNRSKVLEKKMEEVINRTRPIYWEMTGWNGELVGLRAAPNNKMVQKMSVDREIIPIDGQYLKPGLRIRFLLREDASVEIKNFMTGNSNNLELFDLIETRIVRP